jgi:hypothetical protein
MASDLAALEARLDDPALAEDERAQCRDRLSLLAGRVPWIADGARRAWLEERLAALWQRFENAA